MLEVARVARAGFPTRYTHAQFAQRYNILLSPEEQASLGSAPSALVVRGSRVVGSDPQPG